MCFASGDYTSSSATGVVLKLLAHANAFALSRNILFFSCSFSFHPALLRLPEANPNRSEKRVSSRPRSIRVACRSSPSMPVFTFRVAVREKAFSESFITFLSRPFLCRLPYTFPICLLFFRVFFVRTKTAARNYLSTISFLFSFCYFRTPTGAWRR